MNLFTINNDDYSSMVLMIACGDDDDRHWGKSNTHATYFKGSRWNHSCGGKDMAGKSCVLSRASPATRHRHLTTHHNHTVTMVHNNITDNIFAYAHSLDRGRSFQRMTSYLSIISHFRIYYPPTTNYTKPCDPPSSSLCLPRRHL